ncbi:MAG: sodium/proton-translocating pyrophosphatase [Planctomycetota bacterium]|nr:sodium/proton-translocating pyrophosphatase [Planctomycetota bacterium]
MLGRIRRVLRTRQGKTAYLGLLACLFVGAYLWLPAFAADTGTPAGEKIAAAPAAHSSAAGFKFFEPLLNHEKFNGWEQTGLIAVLIIAIIGLLYALMLRKQVLAAPQGTKKMQEVAEAIREGANAYLGAQFRKIGPLIVIITIALFFTKWGHWEFAFGRAGAFLVGALFSWCVGFVGMRLATAGNLRVATAARNSYGEAMQLGYRTGTVAGMLTDGLGLLGGTCIFLIYGEQAYEALLGFGFGGTLLALFMRVGGGIYTKAADVGADLVGKFEADIPEDDPRNAATIADNVGDNVGDCAGMAADIFESYEVTIVAAMILGMASFGHKGVIFPLLVRGIGVLGSIISTYTVKAGPNDTSDTALHSVHRGFWIGSVISVIGFVVLGFSYLKFDDKYMKAYPQAVSGFQVTKAFQDGLDTFQKENPTARTNDFVNGYQGAIMNTQQPGWYMISGADTRPIITCFIGIMLAIVLNKLTSYYTHTSHAPVKSLARACQTGHATNIIQGFSVGYESAVMVTLVLAAAIAMSVACYTGTSAVFVAYGVAMAGIGMLTLTGNTISMDVFGPVADNANGIGEMGYEKEEMGEESYKRARQILADLDAVGNTTKAETKGIAIGSAVIAAVSMFASFIATLAMGSEEKIMEMSQSQYEKYSALLTVADPKVLIGLLIGGTVPWLFSSMLIRAVGRAAFYIIKECRIQFRDKEIWAGTKKPDYGRVVDICTNAAQSELIGPALLGVLSPMLVGLLLGPFALGGFLAGIIVSGVMLGVFMANAGGAWDNAKKMIEDEPRDLARNLGKGSEKHKAAVTGDTVGDPLKDTAGPAINPMVKVMNMVAMLSLTSVVLAFNMAGDKNPATGVSPNGVIGALLCLVFITLIVWAIINSNKETAEMKELDNELGGKS